MRTGISALLMVMLCIWGCERFVEKRGEYKLSPEKIFAEIEDAASTKTAVSDYRIVWNAGDEIALFADGVAGSCYVVSEESVGGSNGDFTQKTAGSKGGALDANVAIYPYAAGLSCTGKGNGSYAVSGVSFPSIQQYCEGSFGDGSFPMAAVSKDETFSFKNVGGVLKLRLTGTHTVSSICVKGNSGEKLSGTGTVTVYADGSAPVFAMGESASEEVTLECGQGVTLSSSKETEFLISLPPVDFAKGFTVTVKEKGGRKMTVKTVTANPVSRSGILKMPPVVFEANDQMSPVVDIQVKTLRFNEVIIKVNAEGGAQFSGGWVLEENYNVNTIIKNANWKIAPRITGSFVYEGPMTGFPQGEATMPVPGKTYVVWVASYREGQNKVTDSDIHIKKIVVPNTSSGGTLQAEVVNTVIGNKSVEASLKASGAYAIYAAFLTSSELSKYSSESARISYLLNNASPVSSDNMKIARTNLTDNTPVSLLALAVDSNGCYGPLKVWNYKTSPLEFNDDIKVLLNLDYDMERARIQVLASGGDIVRYYYYIGKTSGNTWTSTMGGSQDNAERFILLNYDYYALTNTSDNPLVDGCIIFDDYDLLEEYVIIVMAMDSNGRFSRSAMILFAPEVDLGNFVYKSVDPSKWNATAPKVVFGDCSDEGEFYMINWKVNYTGNITVYALCSHPNVMNQYNTTQKKAARIFDKGVKVQSGKMYTDPYGDKSSEIYVTWCDAQGNFYEPFSVVVP